MAKPPFDPASTDAGAGVGIGASGSPPSPSATPSPDPAATATPPKPAVTKAPTPESTVGKLKGLDNARKQMAQAHKDATAQNGPFARITNARDGTAEDRTDAYGDAYSAASRFYGALRSPINVDVPVDHPTLGVGPSSDVALTDSEKAVAELPALALSPYTADRGSALKEAVGNRSVSGWFRNKIGGKYSAYGSEHSVGNDRLVAQHLDKERERLKSQLTDDKKALEKSIKDMGKDPTANADADAIAAAKAQLTEINDYMASDAYEKKESLAEKAKNKLLHPLRLDPDSFEAVVVKMDRSLDACDHYMHERIARGMLIGYGNLSEHDLQRKKSAWNILYIFDHPGCKVKGEINNDGTVSCHIYRLSMFSRAGAMMGIGQMIGAHREKIAYELPAYEKDKDGNIKKDADGQPIIQKNADGSIKYEYAGRFEDAMQVPFELTGVPTGWSGQAAQAVFHAFVYCEKMGIPMVGMSRDTQGKIVYAPGFLEGLTNGMSHQVKNEFLNRMNDGKQDARVAAEEELWNEEILDPYFDCLAEQELLKEYKEKGMLGKGLNMLAGIGSLGISWRVAKAQKAAELKAKMITNATPEERQKNINFIAQQSVMKMGGHRTGGPEAHKIDGPEDGGTESLRIIPAGEPGSAFSAEAGEGGGPGKKTEADEKTSGISSGPDTDTDAGINAILDAAKEKEKLVRKMEKGTTSGGVVTTDADGAKTTHTAKIGGKPK